MKALRNWLSDFAAFIRYYPLAAMMLMAEREAAAENKRLSNKALREVKARHGRKS